MDIDQTSELCCPICLSCYTEKENVPLMFQCGHTTCSKCVQSLLSNNHGGDSKKCGECRQRITVGSIRALPTNFLALTAVESLKRNENKYLTENKKVEEIIDHSLKEVAKSKSIYYSREDDIKRNISELEECERNLNEAKRNIGQKFKNLKKTKSLNETLVSIEEIVSNIKDVERQSELITRRLTKEEDIGRFQSLFDDPEDYFFTSERTKGHTSCFVRNGLMYIKSFPQQFKKPRKFEMKMNTFRHYILRTFIIITYKNVSSLIEFELFDKDGVRGKQFIETCLGEKKSYRGNKSFDHNRLGKEGESISFGHSGDDERSDNTERGGYTNVDYIRMGHITTTINDKVNNFKIYLEGWPSRGSPHCFGRVVRGLSILKSALRNKFAVKITECGVVLDFSVDI